MTFLISSAFLIGAAVVLWRLPRNSRWQWKLLGRVTAGILACACVLVLLLFVFVGGMCGRYEFPEISSKDGRFVARVSEEDCGAVDSFHSSVQLWQNRQGISARLFGRRGHSEAVFAVGNDPRFIDLTWKNDRTLLIVYPNDSRDPSEFRCQSQRGAIHIECVGYAPDYSRPVGEMPPVHRLWW